MYIMSIWDKITGCEKNCSFVPNKMNIFSSLHMEIFLILKEHLSFQSLLKECTHLLHLVVLL